MGLFVDMFFVFYKYLVPNGTIDFFVEEKIMVELKALIQLEDVHLAQGKNLPLPAGRLS